MFDVANSLKVYHLSDEEKRKRLPLGISPPPAPVSPPFLLGDAHTNSNSNSIVAQLFCGVPVYQGSEASKTRNVMWISILGEEKVLLWLPVGRNHGNITNQVRYIPLSSLSFASDGEEEEGYHPLYLQTAIEKYQFFFDDQQLRDDVKSKVEQYIELTQLPSQAVQKALAVAKNTPSSHSPRILKNLFNGSETKDEEEKKNSRESRKTWAPNAK